MAVGALSGVRVIDLATERGVYAGKLLGDLGADVIRVEPSSGDPLRMVPPFWRGEADPNKSIYFWHHNTSKRSVVLDIGAPSERDRFLKLVESADVLIESGDVGDMRDLGLDYLPLSRLKPELIYVSITPFGQSGPSAVGMTNNLVLSALAGIMNVNGDTDMPPLAAFEDQSYLVAAKYAVTTILAAILYRRRSGTGQHIDVSIEAAIASFTHWTYLQTGVVPMRTGALNLNAFAIVRCRDGYCAVPLNFNWDVHLAWMLADGFGEELIGLKPPMDMPDAASRRANLEKRLAVVAAWAGTKDVNDLAREGQQRRLTFGKVTSVDEVFTNQHLRDRGFFVPVHHAELDATFAYPGAPYRMMGTPWAIQRRPPLVGEHTVEVLEQERGFGEGLS